MIYHRILVFIVCISLFINQSQSKNCDEDDTLKKSGFSEDSLTVATPSATITKEQPEKQPCDVGFHCIPVVHCGPLMYLVNLQRPVPKELLRFLKSQICATNTKFPKVCCKMTTPSSLKEFSTVITAMERLSATTMSLEEKSVRLNKFFNRFNDLII
ncbi:hypothetical protein Zmor_019525 [Zophobas morio]|uniref:Clip domain-containing protein n=1 Tax=Zophobas morio TaxID=2755281 RepID=A0AA38M8J3_9CUCU|nr:hypothetical protein Zmor_019525 [Zophobas morio]